MIIVFYLTAILIGSWVFGLALAIILDGALPFSLLRVRGVRFTLPMLGFTGANLIWWFCTYQLELRDIPTLLLLAGVIVLAVVVLFLRRFSRRLLLPLLPARSDWPALVVILLVGLASTWQYIVAGFGNYVFFNDTDWFLRIIPSVLNHQDVSSIIHYWLTAHPTPEISNNRVLYLLFPLQMSITMFLERLFGISANDAAVLHSIIEVVLTGLGAYWVARSIVRMKRGPSTIAGIFAVVAQFYFHTYLDGHIGSIIYGTAVPYFFGMCAWALGRDRYRSTVIAIAIYALFMWKAYPPVIFLLVMPLMLARARLLYLDKEAWLRQFASGKLKVTVTTTALRVALAVFIVLVSIPALYEANSAFYSNRATVLLVGYPSMFITFHKQVLEWFYGLRITNGFGYGFLDPGTDVHVYDAAATLLGILLTIAAGIACWRLFKRRVDSFLATFLLTLPIITILFAVVYPYSYFVYKVLYCHYVLWGIGVVYGLHYLLNQSVQRRNWLAATAVAAVALAAIVINGYGTYRNSGVSLMRSQTFSVAEMDHFARRLKAAGVRQVSVQSDGNNFTWGIITYSLRNYGIDVINGWQIGRDLVTPQFAVFAPIHRKDAVLTSENGKYVLSRTPTSVFEVGSYQSPEVGRSIVYRWLHAKLDYDTFTLATEIRRFASHRDALGPHPVICNDLSDSGFYSRVNIILAQYHFNVTQDPRACNYVLMISHRLRDAIAARLRAKNAKLSSLLTNVLNDSIGRQKIVSHSLPDAMTSDTFWKSNILEVDRVAPGHRDLTPPPGVDAQTLKAVIKGSHLAVTDDISPSEYERYYIEDQLAAAGIRLAPIDKADAVLLALPDFATTRAQAASGDFMKSVIWQSAEHGTGYQLYLLRKSEAVRMLAQEKGPFWQAARSQPMRTLLFPADGGSFLTIQTLRTDRDLRLLLETGRSLVRPTSTLRVMRIDGEVEPLYYQVSSPSQLISIPLKHFAQPGQAGTILMIEPNPQPHQRVMPADDRLLEYTLTAAQLVPPGTPLYTDKLKVAAQASTNRTMQDPDIVDDSAKPALALGQGWYKLEAENGSLFRWMSDHSEIVFEANKTPHRRIFITGLVGPAAGDSIVTLTASVNGKRIASQDVLYSDGRVNLVLDFDRDDIRRVSKEGQNIIRLSASTRLHQADDPRTLKFRVFEIGFSNPVATQN